eukprot:6192546-Pleurochrysis_carterae.AAC.2
MGLLVCAHARQRVPTRALVRACAYACMYVRKRACLCVSAKAILRTFAESPASARVRRSIFIRKTRLRARGRVWASPRVADGRYSKHVWRMTVHVRASAWASAFSC